MGPTSERTQTVDAEPRVRHAEGWVRGRSGVRLFEQSWAPESPKAVVVLVHGFAEHSSRHEAAAVHFARNGYAAQLFDLRGHGRSDGRRCYVADFDEYLDDTEDAARCAAEKWAGRPVFLLAHSLGGLVASLFVLDERATPSGLVLSAAAVKLGKDYSTLKIVTSLIVGRVIPGLPMVRFRSESVSRDPRVVEGYQNDPLVFHGRTPARTASEIVRATRRLASTAERLSVPLFVSHGSRDQVADIDGSRELHDRATSLDKTLRIYDGLWHEIMHEPEAELVLREMTDWMDSRVAA